MILARAFAVLTAALATVLATAAVAIASTPTNWEKGDPLTTLQVLGTFVGIPLGLVIGISLIAMAINTKSRHHTPTPPSTEVETTGH